MSTARRLAAVPREGPALDARYIRVSSIMGRDDERFLSPDLQRQAIERSRAAAGPSVLIAEEVDLDVSGGSMDRPGLNRLLEMARTGQITRLWVLDLSRWARTTTEGLAELERIELAGCKVMSTAEQVELGTPEGYFNATLMLAVHKMRRDQIARGWRSVIAHRSERGHWHGQVPMGYRRAEAGGIEPDPVIGPAMVEVFRRYAAGEVMAHIAADFNRARGKPSHLQTDVKRALRRSVYIGKVRLGDREFDGLHAPLVSLALWRRVQVRLDAEAQVPPRARALAHTLTGLVICGVCGGPVNYHSHGSVRKLECREHSRGRCTGPGQPIASRVVDEVLVQLQVRLNLVAVEDAAIVAVRASGRTRAQVDRRKLSRELDRTREARGRLAVDLARRLVDERAFRLADAELAGAEASLVSALAAQNAPQPKDRRQAMNMGSELLAKWPDLQPHNQNRGLRLFLQRVVLSRGETPHAPMDERINIQWRTAP